MCHRPSLTRAVPAGARGQLPLRRRLGVLLARALAQYGQLRHDLRRGHPHPYFPEGEEIQHTERGGCRAFCLMSNFCELSFLKLLAIGAGSRSDPLHDHLQWRRRIQRALAGQPLLSVGLGHAHGTRRHGLSHYHLQRARPAGHQRGRACHLGRLHVLRRLLYCPQAQACGSVVLRCLRSLQLSDSCSRNLFLKVSIHTGR
mmetsp:Transcript_4777/g.14753  ORF Transcript_4777/g.14753 Transcript_4777/m.14753 type:complete len:201 (+) Transcript_4777:1152-1754(+)